METALAWPRNVNGMGRGTLRIFVLVRCPPVPAFRGLGPSLGAMVHGRKGRKGHLHRQACRVGRRVRRDSLKPTLAALDDTLTKIPIHLI